MNILLTAKQVFHEAATERYKNGDKEGRLKRDKMGAAGSAIFAVGRGVADGTPGFQQIADAGGALVSEGNAGKAAADYLKGYLPQGVQAVARATDHKKRQTKGFLDAFKEGVPGLRQTLKVKR